jgi:hypothetical protein
MTFERTDHMNSHSGWMRTRIDFGSPMLALVVPCNSEPGLRIQDAFQEINLALDNKRHGRDYDAEEQVEAIMPLVERYRPQLKGASLLYVAFMFDRGPGWQLLVCHPSIPRTPAGMEFPVELLQCCAMCGKGLKVYDYEVRIVNRYPEHDRPFTRLLCSEACGRAFDMAGQPFGLFTQDDGGLNVPDQSGRIQ